MPAADEVQRGVRGQLPTRRIFADKVLKGDAKPADLPVQQAAKFEFVINLEAAKQIGLRIPNRVLERANQVNQF